MRAVYRWLILFKFVLVLGAGLFLTHLLQKKKYILTFLFCSIIIFDLTPNIFSKHEFYTQKYHEFITFQQDVLPDMREELNSGDKVFFLSGDNDFLVTYLAGVLDVTAYNVSGDKNIALASQHWPKEIREMRQYKDLNENIHRAFFNLTIDKLVIPYFNLRWNTYSWPPSSRDKASIIENRYSALDRSDPRFHIVEKEWFAVVTPAGLREYVDLAESDYDFVKGLYGYELQPHGDNFRWASPDVTSWLQYDKQSALQFQAWIPDITKYEGDSFTIDVFLDNVLVETLVIDTGGLYETLIPLPEGLSLGRLTHLQLVVDNLYQLPEDSTDERELAYIMKRFGFVSDDIQDQ